MSASLQGRRIVVTGAATGIGHAAARRLAAAGARLALWDIDEPAVSTLAAELSQSGRACIGLGVDVSKAAAVEAALAGLRL